MEVLVDRREMRSPIPRLLSENGVHVIYRILPVGDYQVSEEVIVERKRVEDFVNSILDGRLFQQAKELYAACAHPIIIVEGNWNGYTRCVSKNAVYGAVSALAVDFGLPVLNFENENESTQFLLQMIKRINGDGRVPKIRFEKKPRSMAELQEYLIAGLPDVSTVLSRRLLECFKTPLAVFNAGAEELAQVKGLGMRKAQEIVSVLRSCWDRNDGY
jgi:Fanconi anemia group M protein